MILPQRESALFLAPEIEKPLKPPRGCFAVVEAQFHSDEHSAVANGSHACRPRTSKGVHQNISTIRANLHDPINYSQRELSRMSRTLLAASVFTARNLRKRPNIARVLSQRIASESTILLLIWILHIWIAHIIEVECVRCFVLGKKEPLLVPRCENTFCRNAGSVVPHDFLLKEELSTIPEKVGDRNGAPPAWNGEISYVQPKCTARGGHLPNHLHPPATPGQVVTHRHRRLVALSDIVRWGGQRKIDLYALSLHCLKDRKGVSLVQYKPFSTEERRAQRWLQCLYHFLGPQYVRSTHRLINWLKEIGRNRRCRCVCRGGGTLPNTTRCRLVRTSREQWSKPFVGIHGVWLPTTSVNRSPGTSGLGHAGGHSSESFPLTTTVAQHP